MPKAPRALQASAGTLSEAAAVAYGYYTSSLLALGGSVATLCVLTDAPVVAAAGDSGASVRPQPDVELRPCTGVEAESGTRARDTSVSVGGAGETRSLPLSSALVAARCEVGWREGLAVVRNDRQLLFALLALLALLGSMAIQALIHAVQHTITIRIHIGNATATHAR